MEINLDLPDKLFFKIGEVSKLLGEETHTLRFWEKEFPTIIKPEKSRTQQRLYKKRDIENFYWIKKYLREEKYTISGARDKMRQASGKKTEASQAEKSQLDLDFLKKIKGEIKEIINHIQQVK